MKKKSNFILFIPKFKFDTLVFCCLILIFHQSKGQNTSLSFQEGIEKTIKGNEIDNYSIKVLKGELLQLNLLQKNVDIGIKVFSPTKDSINYFDSPNGKNGLEAIELPIEQNGTYTFRIGAHIPISYKDSVLTNFINGLNGSYRINKFKVLSINQHKELIKYRRIQRDSVIQWIKNKSITIKDVKAKTEFKDLMYLKPVLNDAKVVGLGETSHGAKEIFQMKHRMLEFLVKELGFTLFGIEASNIGCRPINDYVLYGKGNSRDALSAQGFWIWNVESVIDMIEWMHDYNKTVPTSKKVKFVGVDTQINGLDLAFENVNAFLRKTKPHELLEVSTDSLFEQIKIVKDKSDLGDKREKLYRLLSYLLINEVYLVNKSTSQEYINITNDLKKIIQGVEAGDRKFRNKVNYNLRDEYMAQTIIEELRKEGSKSKMMLWAHNGHISKSSETFVNGSQKPLGSVLKRYLGDEKYYAIGFATNQGSFQARNYSVKKNEYLGVDSFRIYPSKKGSLDWCFERTKKNIFFIDFKNYPNYNAVQSFLNEEIIMHTASSTWTNEYSYSPTAKITPKKSFDGMIFIKETSSAKLTPGGIKEIKKRIKNGK